jgi:hypothetical protein
MSQKSILEQALLQVQTLEEAVKQNAKGILASTMKQELNDLLREQAEEEEVTTPEDEEQGVTDDESGDEETSINDEPAVEDEETADEPESDESDEEGEEGGEDEFGAEDEIPSDDEMSADDEEPSDDDVVDMTTASDDEVLKVFKAMKPEDGIVVKKEGDKISLNVDDQEYIIKLDDEDGASDDMGLNLSESEEEEEEDGTIYEISLDEEEIALDKELGESEEEEEEEGEKSEKVSSKVSSKSVESKKVEAAESAQTFAYHKKGNGGTQFKAGSQGKNEKKGGINEEVETLKKQNAEYKKALVLFKEKLNEVAVFNANLAYATRLFTEHSTTKQEKMNILKRFDSISTIQEAKNLYSSIKTELDTKKPMTESVVEKITSTPQTSSTEVLSEAKAYENPQFRRMKDLMSKIK